ncbi:MAG: ATP-binding cassette domain-containing protein [Bacteroidaceae bacterium]|nr:ATP-binding cassette domain-containing protein [Bacteroidaceae bacterium]
MNDKQSIIKLTDAVARNPLVRLNASASVDFLAGEHIAIVAPNGAGKSLLVDMLTGKFLLREGTLEYDFRPAPTNYAYKNIKYITFRDTYGSSDFYYCYQMRWNQTEQDDVPAVGDFLNKIPDSAVREKLFRMFEIEPMLAKKVVHLSSGELRKMELVHNLSSSPRVLIMDNPFIGLDAQTRTQLRCLLEELARSESLQVVLVLSMMEDVPDFITHVVTVDGCKVGNKLTLEQYRREYAIADERRRIEEESVFADLDRRIADLPYSNDNFVSEEIIRFNNINIRYGERTILKDLNWTVRRGDVWALRGGNGSGKSTLLSLVCADNPQAYACDISLFGRKRGTGESIWEIKKHIGYVSPEMHRAYLKDMPAIEIVASGLFDTIGLYRRPHPDMLGICEWWMDVFGIASLRDKSFVQLSSGEQRLCLLARAFVKDPELLILDEPLHGLDTFNRRRVKRIIEAFCRRRDKTLIMVTHYDSELPATVKDTLTLQRN